MKDFVRKVRSFITFESPVEVNSIRLQFTDLHQKLQAETPDWNSIATRQKLISNYWNKFVVEHFALIFSLPVLVILLTQRSFNSACLSGIFIAALLSFPVMYLFHYRPSFGSQFLPRLEMVKDAYERKEKEQLEKCRQAQLSNFALTLLFIVFERSSGINTLQSSDQIAGLMEKLYGVDRGSLKKNLDLILGSSAKRSDLTDRKQTEIRNRFTEAYMFLEELGFPRGIQTLKELEKKFV